MIATTVDASGIRRAVTKLVEGERFVSCTCCTPQNISCCLLDTELDLVLYPNGAITQGKLPPTVVLDGVQYSLGTLGYGNTTNGAFLESGVWAVYKSGVRTTRRCLISNIATDIEDEFPDTLTATYTNLGLTVTATLTRQTLCRYSGVFNWNGGDFFLNVYNNDSAQMLGNVWTFDGPAIIVVDLGNGPEPALGGNTFSTNVVNQPVGSYEGLFGEDIDQNPITLTVTVTTP